MLVFRGLRKLSSSHYMKLCSDIQNHMKRNFFGKIHVYIRSKYEGLVGAGWTVPCLPAKTCKKTTHTHTTNVDPQRLYHTITLPQTIINT